jgi:uncharacterized protein (DUF305 family)
MLLSRDAEHAPSAARRRGHAVPGAVTLAALVALMLVPAAHAKGPAGTYDRAFLTDMIGHHAMAVEMAEMAQEKATHNELKKVSADIIRTQSAEIDQMRGWLRKWYGKHNVHPGMHHDDMALMDELEEATGAEFEIRFLAQMSVHHAQAIERAEVALKRAKHAQVRKLARAIVKAQEGEIEMFRNWLVAWYAKA